LYVRVTVLYEGYFVFDETIARPDILVRRPYGSYDLIEVKSTPRKPSLNTSGTMPSRFISTTAQSSDFANDLLDLVPRFADLLDVFRKFYFDPAFGRSNSINHVLPVICPFLG
jgi:hypothetical protein